MRSEATNQELRQVFQELERLRRSARPRRVKQRKLSNLPFDLLEWVIRGSLELLEMAAKHLVDETLKNFKRQGE